MKSSGSQIATKVVHALFSVLFLVVAPVAFGDAEDAARAFLKEKGLQEGYDAKRERFVLVGVSFRDVNNINASDIFDLREQMVLEALDQAREDIIKSIDSELLEKVFGKYENELMNAAKIDEEGGVDVSFVPVRKINIDIRCENSLRRTPLMAKGTFLLWTKTNRFGRLLFPGRTFRIVSVRCSSLIQTETIILSASVSRMSTARRTTSSKRPRTKRENRPSKA